MSAASLLRCVCDGFGRKEGVHKYLKGTDNPRHGPVENMMEKAPLSEYLTRGLRKCDSAKIDIEKASTSADRERAGSVTLPPKSVTEPRAMVSALYPSRSASFSASADVARACSILSSSLRSSSSRGGSSVR